MPFCKASCASSFDFQCPVSAGSKSFSRKCLPPSTRYFFASFSIFIVSRSLPLPVLPDIHLRVISQSSRPERIKIPVPTPVDDRITVMKGLPLVGALLLILGILSFVVPLPSREDHSVKIGDAKIGVQTESSKKLPPAVGIILVAGGVGALVFGMRKT